MNKDQKINVVLNENQKELIIRHGEAEKILPPKAIIINGVITGPGAFWETRKSEYTDAKCHVEFGREYIKLVMRANEPLTDTVEGRIVPSPELKKFMINADYTFTLVQLSKLIRMNKHLFANAEEQAKTLVSLDKFNIKVTTEIQKEDNRRGDITNSIKKQVVSEIPMNFVLRVPLYVGEKAKTFPVEICYTVTDAQVVLWLESAALAQLEEETRGAIFETELKRFDGLVCIEQLS